MARLGVDANRSLVTTAVSRYGLAALVTEACTILVKVYDTTVPGHRRRVYRRCPASSSRCITIDGTVRA